jgi:hypothetical protein
MPPSAQSTKRFERIVRAFSIVFIWITATGIGACSLLAGSSRPEEMMVFAILFAVTSAISAGTALSVAGRGKLGRETLATLAIFALTAAFLAYTLPWLAAIPLRTVFRLSRQHVFYMRHVVWMTLMVLVSLPAVLGIGASIVVGVSAGMLMRLRRPAIAGAVGIALLLLFAASFESLSARVVDLVIHYRLDGGNWKVASVNADEMASVLGAATGSMLGAAAAWITMRTGRRAGELTPPAVAPPLLRP